MTKESFQNRNKRILVLCTTDSMIYNFLIPHIRELESMGYVVQCACSRTGDYLDALVHDHHLNVTQINFERSPYNIKNIGAYRQLSRLIHERKIGIIFCHEPVGGAMGRLAGHVHRCKVVYMAHGFHFYKGAPRSSTIYYLVEKALSRFTDVLMTINKEDFEAATRFHAKRVVKTNGIGIDISRFVYRPDKNYLRKVLDLPDDSILMLSVGELIHRKNHKTVILAMKDMPSRYHYIVAGDGELTEKLQAFVEREGLQDRVHLLGYRRDISEICNAADIFVMPSYQEGLSVALMEAMTCRLPVVASRIRGNIDLIDEGKGGFLVAVDCPEQYAKAVLTVTENDLGEQFGLYNSERVKDYDIQIARQQIRKVFEEL